MLVRARKHSPESSLKGIPDRRKLVIDAKDEATQPEQYEEDNEHQGKAKPIHVMFQQGE
jgi:hypothetical protein